MNNKRKILKPASILCLGLLTACASNPKNDKTVREDSKWETATSAVKNMHAGWNLSNTLDSSDKRIKSENPTDYETAWRNPVIIPELIKAVKAGGFNAVRIPITWWQNMDEDGNVRKAWMNRIEEVVNYVLDEDMYCILNTHHDTGASDVAWLRADIEKYDVISERFATLWKQIAERFINYDNRLLFEACNEILDSNFTWTAPTQPGAFEAVNKLAQVFVTTVRETGGNNKWRNLVVNPYSSDSGEASVSQFKLPIDEVENHLIVEVHIYRPDGFTAKGREEDYSEWTAEGEKVIDLEMERLNKYFVSKGIPVIIGEFGAHDKGNMDDIVKYASYFVNAAWKYDITCFWWFDLLDRKTYEWTRPQIKDVLVNKKYHSNLL